MTQVINPVRGTGRRGPVTIRVGDFCLVASASGRTPGRRPASRAAAAAGPQAHVAPAARGCSPKVGLRAAGGATGQHSDGTHHGAVFGAVEVVVQPGSGEGISS